MFTCSSQVWGGGERLLYCSVLFSGASVADFHVFQRTLWYGGVFNTARCTLTMMENIVKSTADNLDVLSPPHFKFTIDSKKISIMSPVDFYLSDKLAIVGSTTSKDFTSSIYTSSFPLFTYQERRFPFFSPPPPPAWAPDCLHKGVGYFLPVKSLRPLKNKKALFFCCILFVPLNIFPLSFSS